MTTTASTRMKPLTAADPEARSVDVVSQNIASLKAMFPELLTETQDGPVVNVDVLKQLVGDRTVTDTEEKYGLTWHGKRAARRLALTPSLGTLRPCPEESVEWDTTQNLMIEGDNLEVLKLLQKSYAGKVKLIYIDPPYNTGKDFVYPDDFTDNVANYLMLTGQLGADGRRISSNTESSGRFHGAWLNMMYPRLKLAHGLLTRDGAIFVSCDETEQPRVRLALDEIFGQENFVADLVWAAGRKNDSRLVSVSHEYIVCYARDAAYLTETKIEWRQRKKGLDEIYAQYERLKRQHKGDYAAMTEGLKAWFKALADGHPAKAHKHYCHIDARGVYFPDNISWPGGGGPKYEVKHPKTHKPVAIPSRGWMTSDPEKMRQWIAEDRVHFGPDETSVPCIKSYLKDREYQAPYSVFYQDGRAATKRLRELMGDDCFDFPKDEVVLQELIGMMTSGTDVVMDFFAGSGTTAHAVMAQNATDGASRRFILVQLPEPLDPEDESQKAAAAYCRKLHRPLSIAELTKERLRRASKEVLSEHPECRSDMGFRTFKLDSSNILAWDSAAAAADVATTLLSAVDHIKPDRTEADVLYELLLKYGLDLSVPIEARRIAGVQVHAVGAGALIVCLARSIKRQDVEPLAEGLVQWRNALRPAGDVAVLFRDDGFADDVVKTNMTALLVQRGFSEASIRSV